MQVACVPALLAFWCLSLRGVGTWHTTPFTQQKALVESVSFFVGTCKEIFCAPNRETSLCCPQNSKTNTMCHKLAFK